MVCPCADRVLTLCLFIFFVLWLATLSLWLGKHLFETLGIVGILVATHTHTFVEHTFGEPLNSGGNAFLRCIADSTPHTPCRDSLLTLVLKSTFCSNTNNVFLGHLSCDGGGDGGGSSGGGGKHNRHTTSSDILNTLKYSSRVLQSKATVNVPASSSSSYVCFHTSVFDRVLTVLFC